MHCLPLLVVAGMCGLTSALESLSVSISTEHEHIYPGTDLNIMCKADKPITQCQFKNRHLPIYDLSQGFFTPLNDEFSYFGEGLDKGDCGVTLKGNALEFVVYVVGCRVRSGTSDWVYSEMTLINKSKDKVNVTISPGREVVALPGSPIKLLVDAGQPLMWCGFVLTNAFSKTNNRRRFSFDQDTRPAASNAQGTDIEYYGSGVSTGQCGLQVAAAKEEHNDGAFVDVFPDDSHEETIFFRLIVARAPETPALFYNTSANQDGTLALHAWCFVRSRPASNVTWFLGGERISDDRLEFILTDAWTWPSNIQVVQQKLTLTLTPAMNGKDLWCSAQHVALQAPKESTRMKLTVESPPSAPILELLSPGLSDNSWLEATCSVYGGQPGLKITWYLGNDVVRRDDKNDDPQGQRTTQKLKYLMEVEDNGRDLRCEVAHPTLPQPLQATRKIRFTLCPPLHSDTVLIACSLAGETVDCETPQQVGTVASLVCKSGHVVAASTVYRRIRCMRNASWDRPVFACTPGCGKRNTNSGTVLVSGGEESKIGEFPWHVGVYEMASPTKIVQTCGGTLISPNVVVSAAHCFWNNDRRRPKDASLIKLAMGKHVREWDDPTPHVQKRDVSQIVLPQRYSGRVTQFASDIGLLRMKLAIEVTAKVNIICIDWDSDKERKQLQVGNNGTVAGWGYTEDGQQSDVLKYVNLPYVDESTCTRVLSDEVEQVFTHDKFCAGYVNKNTSVCRGDSGGGLVFRDPGTDSYYLRGVVSISFTPSNNTAICYSQLYTGFTKVSLFIPWILEHV